MHSSSAVSVIVSSNTGDGRDEENAEYNTKKKKTKNTPNRSNLLQSSRWLKYSCITGELLFERDFCAENSILNSMMNPSDYTTASSSPSSSSTFKLSAALYAQCLHEKLWIVHSSFVSSWDVRY